MHQSLDIDSLSHFSSSVAYARLTSKSHVSCWTGNCASRICSFSSLFLVQVTGFLLLLLYCVRCLALMQIPNRCLDFCDVEELRDEAVDLKPTTRSCQNSGSASRPQVHQLTSAIMPAKDRLVASFNLRNSRCLPSSSRNCLCPAKQWPAYCDPDAQRNPWSNRMNQT
jgi:hypothetical protein